MPTPLPAIELRQLAKVFPGGIDALQPIDLTISQGELLVVLGPSGSGKSTLLRLIAGLEAPSSGSVWFDGARHDARGSAPARRGHGLSAPGPVSRTCRCSTTWLSGSSARRRAQPGADQGQHGRRACWGSTMS